MLEVARRYTAAGLSVVPLREQSKAPIEDRPWTPQQHAIADDAQLTAWWGSNPIWNIGVVGGAVSGHLAIIDADEPGFYRWLMRWLPSPTIPTWIVRTGSGKIHIYLRSGVPVPSSVMVRGIKLGELRGEGQYAAVPPSRHPDTHEPYVTLAGDPEHIYAVSDAAAMAEKIADAYAKTITTTVAVTPIKQDLPIGPCVVLPVPSDATRQALKQKLGRSTVPQPIKDIIFKGYSTHGDNRQAAKYGTDSHRDFHVIAVLREHGFTEDEVRDIFRGYAVGDTGYRNTERAGSFGEAHVDRGLNAWTRKHAQDEKDGIVGRLEQENFTVVGVREVAFDTPVWEVRLRRHISDEILIARIPEEEFYSQARFERRLATVLKAFPKWRAGFKSKEGFNEFIDALLRTAMLEEVPDAGTAEGYLRLLVVEQLTKKNIPHERPTDFDKQWFGWVDDSRGVLCFRGQRLVRAINGAQRNPVTPDRIWTLVRNLGGEQRREQIGDVLEDMWVIPLSTLQKLQAASPTVQP